VTITQKQGEDGSGPELIFDTEYVKKMMKFYKQVNEQETMVGAYISTTKLDKESMTIVQYFISLFKNKVVRSPLPSPIILLFDPELNNNKLDIKVRKTRSFIFVGVEHSQLFPSRVPTFQRNAIQIQFIKLRKVWTRCSLLRPGSFRYNGNFGRQKEYFSGLNR
jgi:hypothetical protein